MNLVRKESRERHANGACTVYEYPHNDSQAGVAYAEIRGRYPDKGRALNEMSKEFVLVVKGKGSVSVEGKSLELKEGDSALIMQGERYFFDGSFDAFLCNSPPWSKAQYREVE